MFPLALQDVQAEPPTNVDCHSVADLKIALFRSLLRGRQDLYARRFDNRKTGKSGYAPACGNEWVKGLCEKPKIKCSQCSHRRFYPITDDVVRWHLSGHDERGRGFVMGVYPMMRDETCFFLAVDFDRARWKEDATAFMQTCCRKNIPAALEISRSGHGAHIWLFFAEAISAGLARRLGAHIVTETMERRPDIGFDSYDRFFPNQDTLPQGGFGNLIALPLQKQARQRGHSVFLDEGLVPYADQWKFLSGLRKLGRAEVEGLASDAHNRGQVLGLGLPALDEDEAKPWLAPPSRRRGDAPVPGPLPASLEIVLGNEIYIAKTGLPPGLHNRIIRIAAFENPEFFRAQAMRLPTHEKPRVIACARDHALHLGLPRGCLEELLRVLGDLKIKPILRDERLSGRSLSANFQGKLRPEQKIAAEAMRAHDIGVLAATTAFGKTVVAAWLIAERGVNTLVLVHRRQLQQQWIERLSMFLDLPAKAIGRIGGGRGKPTGLVDVAVIQSLVHKGVVDDVVGRYGQMIIDECHHLSARSFEEVARRSKARYVTGLSATVTRKDGHHPIVFMQCGPVRHCVDARAQAAARPFEHRVIIRPTPFKPLAAADPDIRIQFQDLYRGLIAAIDRNTLICSDVVEAVAMGRSPLILTERNEHLDCLAGQLGPLIRHLIILRGGMGLRAIKATAARVAAIPVEEDRVILATGRYIGEGFDDARLDTLFLTLPVSWHGTIAQYVGRLHRLNDRKKAVCVYDYADLNVPMLARMFDRRCRGYEAVGYKILLPASAVPGWPTEVPLPVDPAWKGDYAASVRRLVRDGVDGPLANLFVHVCRIPSPDAEGADRARSATEAFLFRRLETLPETVGRFALNVELPLAFDGWGRMEVDLFCAEARLAVELDGMQHFADAETYRRDRRKDAMLQEHGCIVLRFLTEDVGRRLDDVLDEILRVLARKRGLGS